MAIVDGGYLFHAVIAACWHFAIWLDIDFDTMVETPVSRSSFDAIGRPDRSSIR